MIFGDLTRLYYTFTNGLNTHEIFIDARKFFKVSGPVWGLVNLLLKIRTMYS